MLKQSVHLKNIMNFVEFGKDMDISKPSMASRFIFCTLKIFWADGSLFLSFQSCTHTSYYIDDELCSVIETRIYIYMCNILLRNTSEVHVSYTHIHSSNEI